MRNIETYDLSKAARMINIKKMGRSKIYKLLGELGIVDLTKKPVQRYIDDGYLDFGLPTIRIHGFSLPTPVTIVVGERGLNFLKKVVEDYLKENPEPVIYRRTSTIMEIDGEIISFRNAFV